MAHGAALSNPVIVEMAKKYQVSVVQLCIRYDWQLNTVVLPKASQPQHIKQDTETDFIISNEDMSTLSQISALDYGTAGHFPVFGGKL